MSTFPDTECVFCGFPCPSGNLCTDCLTVVSGSSPLLSDSGLCPVCSSFSIDSTGESADFCFGCGHDFSRGRCSDTPPLVWNPILIDQNMSN
ncbi:hypothetical protein [Phage toucan80]|nr:hypothetical protein [Phage toucan80]